MNNKNYRKGIIIGLKIHQQIAHDHIYRVRANKQQKYKYTWAPYTLQTWESKSWQDLVWGILPKLALWSDKKWDNYCWGPDIPTAATHSNHWGKHINAVIAWNLLTTEEKKTYCQKATNKGGITGQNLFRKEYMLAPYKNIGTWHIWKWSGLKWE